MSVRTGSGARRADGPAALLPRPGEIVLERASRSFVLVHERSRTLKELLVRRGHASPEPVRALDEVDLRVDPGEAVGLIGRNGAGKTSTLRCLAGIVPLDSGRAVCGGRTVSLLELGAGFGPDFSGRENIFLNGALHGFGRDEMEERVERIIEFSELGDFIDAPVKAYSSGMQLRLGFSIVAHLDADVMLIDEILAVGDESFQRKCMARIAERMAAGTTLVLVSHDPSAVERICRRVVVLDDGKVAYDGDTADGLLFYHRMLGTEEGRSKTLRPSTGERAQLEVTELDLLDAEDRQRAAFRSGEEMGVRMRLSALEPAERAVVALEVRDQKGDVCFRTDETVGELAGETVVSFRVPRLNLLGGDYDVAVGAYDHDAPASGLLDRVARFSVAHTLDGEGVADLRGTWSLAGRREVLGGKQPARPGAQRGFPVTSPEEAGDVAAHEARRRREAGGYAGVGARGALDETIVSGEPSLELLAQWAVIEIEPDEILYSTRRGGAPITWAKRLLVRLLRQYFVELEARQTRFNIALLERLDALEERARGRREP